MRAQVPISVRCILPSWIIGIAVTTVLLMLLVAGVASPLVRPILRPGLLLAGLMKYGEWDWQASILVVLGNSIFYGAIVLVIMLVMRKR
jgi:hypothetical protein